MRRLYFILTIIGALFVTEALYAQQEETPQRRTPQTGRGSRTETTQTSSSLPDLTVRAQEMNERNTQEIGNARWMRVLYRQLDLTKEVNAPLYYPTRPMNGNMNLFSVVFQLLSEGKLTVYRYEDGYEIFDEEHQESFKNILDRMRVYYEEIPGRGNEEASYVINEADIPSSEILSYYVKEAWFFDQNTSDFDVKTLAICPIMSTVDDNGLDQTMALFWIPYENIRPYINNSYIMTSSLNNAKLFTIDDFFRRRMFDGEIIKTENLMNKTMQEMYPETDSLQLAQKQIEAQLDTFRQSLWFQPDTTQLNTDPKAKKKTSSRGRVASTKEKKAKTSSAPKQKAEKSTPVRSVRRSR